MFQSIQSALKARVLFVFLLIHAGLALGIFALARISYPNGWDLTSVLFLAAVLCLYGGFLLAVAFILIPLLPWLKRAEKVEHWSERLIHDLPQLLAIFQKLLAIWNEAKNKSATDLEKLKPS